MGLEDILKMENISGIEVTLGIPEWIKGVFSVKDKTNGLGPEYLAEKLATAKESKEVRDMYLADMHTIFGKAINKILDWKGYKPKLPDNYTYLDLPEHVMAATIALGNSRVILAYNSKYAQKLKNNKLLRLYVNLHEQPHVRGEQSESYTEGLVGDAARYVRKLLSPFYRLGGKFKEAFENAAAIERYAKLRESAQYGK